MTKYFLAFCLLFMIHSTSVFGQMSKIGIRTGINMAKTPVFEDGDNIDEDEVYARGFILALPMEFQMQERLNFVLEPTFIQKGSAYSEKEVNGDYKSIDRDKVHVNYLELPLSLKFRQQVGDLQIHLEGGAFFGYLLSAKFKAFDKTITENSRTVRRKKTKIEIDRDEFVSLDAGFLAGAGISKTFGFGELSLGIRYQLGLVNQEDKSSEDDNVKIFTRGINLTLGISRPISGNTQD